MEYKQPTTQTGKDIYNSWILDIEANGLEPTKIHFVVLRALNDSCVLTFKDTPDDRLHLRHLLDAATLVVGHNIIDYDLYNLDKLWNISVSPTRVLDTLVCSHLLNYAIDGGHGLKAWGIRLGEHKGEYTGGWEEANDEMLEYCIQDTYVNLLLYNFLMERLDASHFKKAIKVEHDVAFICREMQTNGFTFDKDKATELLVEVKANLLQLDVEIKGLFPQACTNS